MSLPTAGERSLGPVHCAWFGHRHGTPSGPRVRDWLGSRLAIDPAALELTRDAHCRPQLGGAHADFDANWSHSGDRLLVALGEGVHVGADIERLRPRPRALDLAQRYFAPEEAAWLGALPAAAREHAFLELWCAKEAVLKAHGRGLSFGLHRLRFERTGEGLVLVACDPLLGRPGDWTLHALVPEPGFTAAVAWRPR